LGIKAQTERGEWFDGLVLDKRWKSALANQIVSPVDFRRLSRNVSRQLLMTTQNPTRCRLRQF